MGQHLFLGARLVKPSFYVRKGIETEGLCKAGACTS